MKIGMVQNFVYKIVINQTQKFSPTPVTNNLENQQGPNILTISTTCVS